MPFCFHQFMYFFYIKLLEDFRVHLGTFSYWNIASCEEMCCSGKYPALWKLYLSCGNTSQLEILTLNVLGIVWRWQSMLLVCFIFQVMCCHTQSCIVTIHPNLDMSLSRAGSLNSIMWVLFPLTDFCSLIRDWDRTQIIKINQLVTFSRIRHGA